jgi:dihydropteroate synthase
MGILNVTPDSFSDGGTLCCERDLILRAESMIREGSSLLDVGGESTRPGSSPVPLEEELGRVIPAVKILVKRFPKVTVSVDTMKAEVARQALLEGAGIVNDVSALRADTRMAETVRRAKAKVILMHMRGMPKDMQDRPRYKNAPREVRSFLLERARFAIQSGIPKKDIWIDPGIGFGKTVGHNLEILAGLRGLERTGYPVVVGCSRKSFIGKLLGGPGLPLPPEERLEGSVAAGLWAASNGATVLRVHDVKETKRALQIFEAIQNG